MSENADSLLAIAGDWRKQASRSTSRIAAVVTAGMGSKWQPIEIGMAATMRADAAIEDHDVADLLTARLP